MAFIHLQQSTVDYRGSMERFKRFYMVHVGFMLFCILNLLTIRFTATPFSSSRSHECMRLLVVTPDRNALSSPAGCTVPQESCFHRKLFPVSMDPVDLLLGHSYFKFMMDAGNVL